MKIISGIAGFLAILAGSGMLLSAVLTPGQYAHTDNAIVTAAIYSEATFKAVIAVALFVFAGVCMMSYQASPPEQEYIPLPGPRPDVSFSEKLTNSESYKRLGKL